MGFFTPQEWISLRGVGFTERSGFLHSPGVDFIEGSGFSLRGVRGSGFLHSPGVDFIEGSGFY